MVNDGIVSYDVECFNSYNWTGLDGTILETYLHVVEKEVARMSGSIAKRNNKVWSVNV